MTNIPLEGGFSENHTTCKSESGVINLHYYLYLSWLSMALLLRNHIHILLLLLIFFFFFFLLLHFSLIYIPHSTPTFLHFKLNP
uniref:Uncharacterized protein n=1 Tax=Cucumis melo TaxID=3656 RepID=A0A9I9EDD3_CUCME